jgi:hypothetical protein
VTDVYERYSATQAAIDIGGATVTRLALADVAVPRHRTASGAGVVGMRGQLVQEPGHMVNYALGPIVAAELRARIAAERGDWIEGDPGWYAWASERLLRFGSRRPAAEVVLSFLGRPPTPTALIGALSST